jgi:outer membrane biosynthesis protein TonB
MDRLPSSRFDVRMFQPTSPPVQTRRAISVVVLVFAGIAPLARAFAGDFHDNRPLRIVQSIQANFPPTLAAEGVTEGEVRAVLNVDDRGKLIDCLVTAYTRRELAHELVAIVRDWSYEPAHQRGEPVSSRVEVIFTFEARGMVISQTQPDTFAASTNRLVRPTLTTLLCPPGELDEPMRAVHVVEPRHPGSRVALRSGKPTVLVDFYIDSEGRPRMPVVLRAAHEVYALAAIEALLQWRFTPPTRQGQPVIARATQLFSFSEPGSNND